MDTQPFISGALGVFVAGCALFLLRKTPLFSASRAVETTAGPAFAPDPNNMTESQRDKRRAHRRDGNPVEIYLAAVHDKSHPQRGWVYDRSTAGLGILVFDKIPEGAKIAVLPVNAPESVPWVEVDVCSCRQVTEGFEVGVQFQRTPPWSVLLLFG